MRRVHDDVVARSRAFDERLDETFGEDAAFGQVIVVGFKSVKGFGKRFGKSAEFCFFFLGKVPQIEVERSPSFGVRIDLFVDTVKYLSLLIFICIWAK